MKTLMSAKFYNAIQAPAAGLDSMRSNSHQYEWGFNKPESDSLVNITGIATVLRKLNKSGGSSYPP